MVPLGIGNREIAETIKGLPLLVARVDALEAKVSALEAEEAREAKQGTIRPGTRRGPNPQSQSQSQ